MPQFDQFQFLDMEIRDHFVEKRFFHLHRLATELPEPRFLIHKLLPATGVVLFSGQPFEGKTTLVDDLIRAVATGGRWLTSSEPANGGVPAPVLILNYDTPPGEMIRRLRVAGVLMTETDRKIQAPIMIHTMGMGVPRVEIKKRAVPALLTLPTWADYIRLAMLDLKPRLVVIDTLLRSFDPAEKLKENNADDMRLITDALRELSQPVPDMPESALIIAITHAPKPSTDKDGFNTSGAKQRVRGSTELVGGVDGAVYVEIVPAHKNKTRKPIGRLTWEKARWETESTVIDYRMGVSEGVKRLVAITPLPKLSDTAGEIREFLVATENMNKWFPCEHIRNRVSGLGRNGFKDVLETLSKVLQLEFRSRVEKSRRKEMRCIGLR